MQDYNEHSIHKYPNGNINTERYSLNGKLHRLDKPAYILYHQDGRVMFNDYYINGNLHRVDGPAYVVTNGYGKLTSEHYCLFGVEITKEEFYTPGFVDSFILEHS